MWGGGMSKFQGNSIKLLDLKMVAEENNILS